MQYDPSPLVNGEVDGFLAYVTNESIIVESQGLAVTNLLFAEYGLPFVAESIIATDETIAERPEVVKAFLEAETKGWKLSPLADLNDLGIYTSASDLSAKRDFLKNQRQRARAFMMAYCEAIWLGKSDKSVALASFRKQMRAMTFPERVTR